MHLAAEQVWEVEAASAKPVEALRQVARAIAFVAPLETAMSAGMAEIPALTAWSPVAPATTVSMVAMEGLPASLANSRCLAA